MKITGKLVFIVSALFFFSLCLFFTRPLGISDMWWHLNSGRWIWQNLELPDEDPFTYKDSAGGEKRKALILKGYWLAQALYYPVYKAGGEAALIVFNSALLTLILYVLWRIIRSRGIEPLTGLLMTVPCAFYLLLNRDVRPQVFSFLFALVLFHLLDRGVGRIKAASKDGLHFLPPLMFFWANLHPGFIIGYAVCSVYLIAETFKTAFRRKGALPGGGLKTLALWSLASVLLSTANPNFLLPVFSGIEGVTNPLTRIVLEYRPPWTYAAEKHLYFGLYALIFTAALTFAFMALSVKRLELRDVLLYGCFAIAGASTHRFVVFFMLLATAVSSKYAPARLLTERPRRLALPAVVALALVFSFCFYRSGFLKHGPVWQKSMPVKAADFLSGGDFPPNIFAPYEWGGYLGFRLHPRHRMFIDARMLDFKVFEDYDAIRTGRTPRLIDAYGVNTVVFNLFHPISRRAQGIVLRLLVDDGWRLVYAEGNAVVFVREGKGDFPAIDKEPLRRSYALSGRLY